MIMPYQSVGDFLVDVMMNQFDLSDWFFNDDSDLYESIDLINLEEQSEKSPPGLMSQSVRPSVCLSVWNMKIHRF